MPTRAELEAQLRELEAKRDRLEEQIARARLAPHPRPEGSKPATPASVLEILDKVLKAMQPQLGMFLNERESLIAEREAAKLRNDPAGESDATIMLDQVSALSVEFSTSVAQLNAAAERIRAAMASEARDDAKEDEAR